MSDRTPRAPRWLLGAIVVAGLVLRGVHLRAVAPYELHAAPPARMDRWLATEIAHAIADGDPTGGWAAPYDSSPGYSYFLAGAYLLGGRSWAVPLVVQLLLGALVPLLLYAAGRRLFGWAAGVVAALFAALYLPAMFYEGLLVKFSLIPFTTAVVLLAITRLEDGPRWSLVAGLALGLLGALRPNTLLAFPLVLAATAMRTRPGARGRSLFAAVAGVALVFLPIAARERVASARDLESALGGIHFYIGTNPQADGEYVILPGIAPDVVGHVADAQRLAEKRAGRRLTRAEISRFWFGEGVRFIAGNPARYALLELRKLWLALEAHELGSFGDDFEEFRALSPVLRLPLAMFGVMLPLALLGVFVARREQAVLPLFGLTLLVSLLPFFVTARYRLPLAPVVILLAAAGTTRLDEWRREGRVARLFASVAGMALVAAAFGADDAQLVTLFGAIAVSLAIFALAAPRADADSVLDVAERA